MSKIMSNNISMILEGLSGKKVSNIEEDNVTCKYCHSGDVTQNDDGSYYCNKCHKNFKSSTKSKKADKDSGKPKDNEAEAEEKTVVMKESKGTRKKVKVCNINSTSNTGNIKKKKISVEENK